MLVRNMPGEGEECKFEVYEDMMGILINDHCNIDAPFYQLSYQKKSNKFLHLSVEVFSTAVLILWTLKQANKYCKLKS